MLPSVPLRKIALDSANLLAKRAFKLDSFSSGARLAMGSYYFHEYNWVQSEKEKRKAVELNPGGSEEKFMLASFLSQFHQSEEAIELSEEALKLSPIDKSSVLSHVRVLFFSRKYDEAVAICKQLIEDNQVLDGAYQFLFICQLGLGNTKEAGLALGNFLKEAGYDQSSNLFFENDFRTAVKKLLVYSDPDAPPFLDRNIYRAQFHSFVNEKEEALEFLYKIYENHETAITWIRSPWFDFLRDDPRYVELYELFGLQSYDDYLSNRKT